MTRSVRRLLLTVPIAAGLGLALTASPVQAASAPVPSHSVNSGTVPVFDASRGVSEMLAPAAASTIIANYWTPERLAAATPVPDAAAARAASNGAVQRATQPSRQVAQPRRPVQSGLAPAVVNFANAEGKVFFHDPTDNSDHSCSGGTVNSGKRRLVLTAGHCVHGGPGKTWMQNWVFFPGYQFGAGFAGRFTAFQLWTETGWINNGDRHFDYAFVITNNGDSNGSHIVDAVGGNGLIVNPGRPFVTAIGYPGNFQNGLQQAFCQVTLSQRSIFISDQQLNCDMRFGASGSPWLENYDNGNQLGSAVSNQSYSLNSDGSGPEFGPYYDNETANLYHTAENASPA